jgi:presenilin 1
MILAALAVQYVNTDATRATGEAVFDQTYQIFTLSNDQSAVTNLGLGLVNALVIVCILTVLTFVIVLLYKYKCLKILIGYMIFASTVLLGLLGGRIFMVAINKYQLHIDRISFYITMYNFTIVGVVAIFYQRGVPTYITQIYLIASSIIVTWQLSYFNDWMAWALLIMLAVYDLFAVLSPCGPLRALVKLMSKDDAPAIPGLLYEARLAENVTRPGRRQQSRHDDAIEERNNNERTINDGNEETDEPPLMLRGGGADSDGDSDDNDTEDNVRNAINNEDDGKTTSPTSSIQANNAQLENDTSVSLSTSALHVSSPNTNATPSTTTIVPLAIARVYKLPINISSNNTLTGAITTLDTSSPTAYLQQEHQFSTIELQMNVEVILPRNGGWIETTLKNGKLRYVIYNQDGVVKRTLLVNEEDGKVMEVVIPNDDTNNNQTTADHHPSDNTIKLGLGDFIFFSVLVSKASVHGFAAFVACFLSILAGLGGTLLLLAVFHHALPALPISIFLAVIMFVLTIYAMEPWIEEGIWSGPYYV